MRPYQGQRAQAVVFFDFGLQLYVEADVLGVVLLHVNPHFTFSLHAFLRPRAVIPVRCRRAPTVSRGTLRCLFAYPRDSGFSACG